MSDGANDYRNCTNCRYSIWDKDDVLACHRRAPVAVEHEPKAEFFGWPEVSEVAFCWEYRPRYRWWSFVQWFRSLWQ